MGYPGSNILNQAMRLITKQSFEYIAFSGNTKNSIGMLVPSYASPVNVMGSVQPMPKRVYQQLGLDLNKSYWNFFISQSVVDVNRDVSSDQFIFNGTTYQCLSLTPWYGIDGWVEVLTVVVP